MNIISDNPTLAHPPPYTTHPSLTHTSSTVPSRTFTPTAYLFFISYLSPIINLTIITYLAVIIAFLSPILPLYDP